MKQRNNRLGLALVATLALGAVWASGAQAAEEGRVIGADAATGEHVGTGIVGESKEGDPLQLTVGGSSVECATSKFAAEIPGGTAESGLTTAFFFGAIQPANQECTAFGFPATATANGCHLTFETFQTADPEQPSSWSSGADLECAKGAGLEIHAYTGTNHSFRLCTLVLLPQAGLQGVTFHNATNGEEPDDLTATFDLEGITATESGAFCEGHETEADLHGSATLTGFDSEEEPVDLSIEHVETEEHPQHEAEGHVVADEDAVAITADDEAQGHGLVLTTPTGSTECAADHFVGALVENPTKSITLDAGFGGPEEAQECTASGFPATITNNGCELHLDAFETDQTEEGDWRATVDLTCPDDPIELHVYLGSNHETPICTQTIPAQSGLEGVTIDNLEGSPDDLTLTVDVDGITVTQHEGVGCEADHFDNATMEGALTVQAVDAAGEPVDLTIEHTDEG